MIEVGKLEEFRERSVRVVTVDGAELGVVRWDGDELYALRNVCPHMGGPVCRGRLGPRVVALAAGPGTMDVDESSPVLRCAWHGWEFDVRSGRALVAGSRYKVKTYPVRLEDGSVLVDLGRKREPTASG